MFTEIGPVIVGEGGKLTPRNHTWNKKFGLLIVDNPAGVGFSVLGDPARPVKTEEQVASVLAEPAPCRQRAQSGLPPALRRWGASSTSCCGR